MPREGVHSQAPLDPSEELARRDELAAQLDRLIHLRWAALALVLGLVSLARHFNLAAPPWPLWGAGVGLVLLNLGFSSLHRLHPERTLRALTSEALLQLAVDVAGLGILLYFSGGLANPGAFCLTLPVLLSILLLERRESYRILALTAAVVVVLALATQIEGLAPWPLQGARGDAPVAVVAWAAPALLLLAVTIACTYLMHAIMERLREQNRNLRKLLADRSVRQEELAAAKERTARDLERMRATLEHLEAGVVLVDLTGKVLLANSRGLQKVVSTLEETFRQAGIRIEPPPIDNAGSAMPSEPSPATPAHPDSSARTPASEACLTEALEHGGKLSPEVLALLQAGASNSFRAPKLRAPSFPILVETEGRDQRMENRVSTVRTETGETLGLLIISRHVTERQITHRDQGNH